MWSMWFTVAAATPLVIDTAAFELVDVDGDGHVDVVVGAGQGVHYGQPGGTPGPVTPLVRDPLAEQARFVDLDTDGVPEVCVATFEVLSCHQGMGRTLGPVVYSEATRVLAMHVVDLDGDGDDDLLVSTLGGLEVRRSDGAGGLASEPALVSDVLTVFVDADIDGDGDLDLSASNAPQGSSWWLERDSGGALLAPAELVDGGLSAFHVGFLDATGDGLPDLLQQSYTFPLYLRERQEQGVVLSSDTTDTAVWKTTGQAGYGPLVALPYSARFTVAELGGQQGLLVSEATQLVWDAGATGAAQGVAGVRTASSRTGGTRVADVDGDAVSDVVIVDRDVRVIGDPLGAATEVTLQRGVVELSAFAAHDVDGDGWTDLLYGDAEGGALFLARGAGGGAFEAGDVWVASSPPALRLAVADLDRDGAADTVVHEEGGRLTVHLASGSTFQSSGVSGLGLALDGDGDGLDEYLVAMVGGGLRWLDDDGAGGLVLAAEVAADPVRALASGDTDGDGVPEVVVLTDRHLVLYRTGAGGWVEADRVAAPGDEPFAVYLTDPDGDGADTVVVHAGCVVAYAYGSPNYPYCTTQELLFGLDEVGGALTSPADFGEGGAPVVSVDWDGDGTDELLTGSATLLYWKDGTLLGYGGEVVVPVDLDGDGDLDLVAGRHDGISALWNGDGVEPLDTGDTGDTGQVGPTSTGETGGGATADTAPDTGEPTTPAGSTTPPLTTSPPTASSPETKGRSCGCAAGGGGGLWLWLLGWAALPAGRRQAGRGER